MERSDRQQTSQAGKTHHRIGGFGNNDCLLLPQCQIKRSVEAGEIAVDLGSYIRVSNR